MKNCLYKPSSGETLLSVLPSGRRISWLYDSLYINNVIHIWAWSYHNHKVGQLQSSHVTSFCCRHRNILFTFYFLLKTQFQWKDHKHTDTVFSFCQWLDLINGWVVAALYFRVSSILVNWWLWFSCSYIFDYLICYMSNNRLPENKQDDAWCVITL